MSHAHRSRGIARWTRHLVPGALFALAMASAGSARAQTPVSPEGIWYTPVTGIWQTVWLEEVPATYIASTRQTPTLSTVTVSAQIVKGEEIFDDYDDFVAKVRAAFGFQGTSQKMFLRSRLAALKFGNDPLTFLNEFEVLTAQLGMTSDVTRVYEAMQKLPKHYLDVFNTMQVPHTSWYTLKAHITVIAAARAGLSDAKPDEKRRRSKCGKCGKKGHTAGQCRSPN